MRSRIGGGRRRGKMGPAVLVVLGMAGLFVYLWAAMRGPVVVWSDSRIDLALARERLGFLGGKAYRDVGGWGHAIKPGYILFLTLCRTFFGNPVRASVVIQSLALFAAIAAVAALVAGKRGRGHGAAFFLAVLAMLSFRDAASAVMSESLATAGFVAAAAVIALARGDTIRRLFLLGAAIAALFLVRPNVGAAAGVLALVGLESPRLRRPVVWGALAAGFLALWAPLELARRAHDPSPGRSGMSSAVLTGSLDYLWPAVVPHWPAAATPAGTARDELRLAGSRWAAMWPPATPEIRRQWIWRAFHALLGTDYYDASWSAAYWRIDEGAKIARPFLVLLAVGWTLCGWRSRETRRFALLGTILILMVVAQSLLVGSLPRYGLPFLAPLLLFAVLSATRKFIAPLLAAAAFAWLVWSRPGVLDREWGRIEKSGVVVRQEIPRNGLDRRRSELRVRIGSLTGATSAELSIEDESGRPLFSSRRNPHPESPTIVVPLPADLVERNRRAPVEIRFVAGGGFDATNFYVFPVVPRPWGAPARREGSRALSPTTGVLSGGLDWW
ncbi:MAG TPA: hypothetical protein VFS34_02740 [Thermoanaerobaculia bacterium]|nr:hypothetical protein [Thermoanaerobaculia bacterium]